MGATKYDKMKKLVEYIRLHGPVSRKDILKEMDISKSTFYGYLKILNSETTLITCDSKQYSCASTADHNEYVSGELTKSLVRRWVILFILSVRDLTRWEIGEEVNRILNHQYGEKTIRADLKALKNAGYITSIRQRKDAYYRSLVIAKVLISEITGYLDYRQEMSKKPWALDDTHNDKYPEIEKNPRVLIKTYEDVDEKLSHIYRCNTDKINPTVKVRGKQNNIPEELTEQYGKFMRYPYMTTVLDIAYKTCRQDTMKCKFSTGMVIYSVKNNNVYLVGKEEHNNDIVIPFNRVCKISANTKNGDNKWWDHEYFQTMYNEMFDVSIEPPTEVKVRFMESPFIREKLEQLSRIRKYSSIRVKSDNEIVYTDRIRGIKAFADYLSQFEQAAIVDEPDILREIVMKITEQTLDLYKEFKSEGI